MKITIYDAKAYDKESLNEVLGGEHELEFIDLKLSVKTAKFAEGSEGICGFVNDEGNKEVLEILSEVGIKFWFQRSAGYDRIDLKVAKKLGIKVWRVPGYSPEGVAEYAMTLLMAINRNVHIAYTRSIHKNFSLEGLLGETIHGQTIGVIGAGRIGQCFIRIANGLGANVIVLDDYAQKNFPNTAKDLGFEYVTKERLFKESDFVSLHAPSTPETKYIINNKTLKLMKKNAIIVNTSRGDLINTNDLLDYLDFGRIRGAGLDVYEHEQEIFFEDQSNVLIADLMLSRLRAHRNVILTAHQAFFTKLALSQIANTVKDAVADAVAGDYKNALDIQADGKVING